MAINKNRDQCIPFIEKLYFHIYTIGYRGAGESIVFFIENDYGIAYSGVIDIYENDNCNKTIEILKENKIDKIDFFCWTHPHKDHSVGIGKILNSYIGINSKIVVPDNIYKMEYEFDDEAIETSMEYIINNFKSNKRIKPKIYSVKGNNRIELKYIGTGVRNSRQRYRFEIETIAPVIDIIEKRYFNEKFYTLNDFSIALIVNLGEFTYLFGGDIQDSTIKKIDFIPEKIDYLKIPHHTSKGSLELLNWFESGYASGIACTTEYSSSGLPNFESLDLYKNYFTSIFSTKGLDEQKYELGVIHTVNDILTGKFYTDLDGNGVVYHNADVCNNFQL